MAPKSLCLTTAFAPVPAFLGGSCPLGCSLSAPATGGFSVVSPQYIRYAAGSKEEKRAWGPLHGGTIAHPFVLCKRGLGAEGRVVLYSQRLLQRRVWLGLRRYPARSALRRFRGQGDSPCTPGWGCAPCPLLGGRRRRRLLTWRVGTCFLTCPCTRGQGQSRPGWGCAPPVAPAEADDGIGRRLHVEGALVWAGADVAAPRRPDVVVLTRPTVNQHGR